MLSTTEESTKNSPISPSQSVIVKKPSAIKSLRQFLEAFYVKPKNDVLRLDASKYKLKAIRTRNMFWLVF